MTLRIATELRHDKEFNLWFPLQSMVSVVEVTDIFGREISPLGDTGIVLLSGRLGQRWMKLLCISTSHGVDTVQPPSRAKKKNRGGLCYVISIY